MRKSNWTPSIVPRADEQDVYLVIDDLGSPGRVWREAAYAPRIGIPSSPTF
jgi:hypothetical protein